MTSTPVREHVILPSPIGPLTLVAEAGQLIALYMDAQQHRPAQHRTTSKPPPEPQIATTLALLTILSLPITQHRSRGS